MSAMPAVHRFLAYPELVEHTLSYLSRERVDLLSLSAVSKAFRAYALRVWARYLDIPASVAVERLQFFKANPQLLSQVRFLRIRNDAVELEPYFRSLSPSIPVPTWAAITSILTLVDCVDKAQTSTRTAPAIDLSLGTTDIRSLVDAFHSCSSLKQNVVALRIIAVRAPNITTDMDTCEAVDIAMDDQREEWLDEWETLAQFISDIQGSARDHANSGLITFHYDGDDLEDEFRIPERNVPQTFWEDLAEATAFTLRDFSIQAAFADYGAAILPLLTFSHLEKFCFHSYDVGYSTYNLETNFVDEFLDRHPHLQELTVHSGAPPSFCQTFPHLQCFGIQDPHRPLEDRIDFARRHPNILATEDYELILHGTDAVASEIYPNLRQLTAYCTEAFEKYAERGGRLSHIRLKNIVPSNVLYLHSFSSTMWLTRFPEAAKAVTCLELDLGIVEDMDRFQASFSSAFTSDFLPNLTELSLIWRKNSPFGFPEPSAEGNEPSAEEKIGPLLAGLVTARSLRILHLSDRTKPFPKKEILVDCVFPQSLEYLVWLDAPVQESQYFRFLDAPPDSNSKPAPTLGKRGKLQRISAMFRTKISPEGVWERPFHAGRMFVILDHINPQS
ncbi:hypothetical protein CF326_g5795 [Tilletia indica]|nr:hypothetical protein CF326_g5795 [Tilletia indica]